MSKEWFIVQFKPNAHHRAVKNLNQQGFETFLPLLDTTSRNGSRFINSSRPLFPGYMFVKFDKTNIHWHKINNTFGVSRLITFNSIIKSIPATVINNLTKRCDLSGKLMPLKELEKGSKVKVLSGPFANFIATVEKYETKQRIWVLMGLMGREAKIQTTLDSIQIPN